MDAISEFTGQYWFLSNFSPSIIEFEHITYPTVEHAFQAAKSLDNNLRTVIANLPSNKAGIAKKYGKKLELRPDWELFKIPIMSFLLGKKFLIPELRAKLLDTGDRLLIEGNTWHDNFWGDCFCAKCQLTEGKNVLGQLLTVKRELFKNKKEINY